MSTISVERLPGSSAMLQGWYRRAIPRAEELYEEYLKEREAEEAR